LSTLSSKVQIYAKDVQFYDYDVEGDLVKTGAILLVCFKCSKAGRLTFIEAKRIDMRGLDPIRTLFAGWRTYTNGQPMQKYMVQLDNKAEEWVLLEHEVINDDPLWVDFRMGHELRSASLGLTVIAEPA
jgi:hypothetical protein